ncbi:MAG: N utilization substance protein A [Candidatus Promineifilaceae bacterium]|jgi:transcription termination/antitermination protein NusA
MNDELLTILNYMEKDRGIDREILIQAVEFALQSVARKKVNEGGEPRVVVDRETCDIRTFVPREVVADGEGGDGLITLSEARELNPDAAIGESVDVEITTANFGRIAAQTAKQAILQKIRQAERDIVFDEYKDRLGDIVSGSVRSFNRGDIIVDLGRAEAVIPSKERVPTEEYQVGDRIRGMVLNVAVNPMGPSVILSRSHPDFVLKLFELEVSEISEGVVIVKGIAREPGFRTKIAVISNDEKVDPVGACVGMRGMRVKNIVRELSGEKIDIIRWSDDTKVYVTNALSPAKLQKVTINPETPTLVHVVAESDQLSLAIGKRGQNVRLTAKLVGMKIDIQKDESEVTFEEKVARAVDGLAAVEGISRESAEKLVQGGFLSIDGILASDLSDLIEATGLEEEDAKAIAAVAAAAQVIEE